jgi:hypothetical protein
VNFSLIYTYFWWERTYAADWLERQFFGGLAGSLPVRGTFAPLETIAGLFHDFF